MFVYNSAKFVFTIRNLTRVAGTQKKPEGRWRVTVPATLCVETLHSLHTYVSLDTPQPWGNFTSGGAGNQNRKCSFLIQRDIKQHELLQRVWKRQLRNPDEKVHVGDAQQVAPDDPATLRLQTRVLIDLVQELAELQHGL